MRSYLILSMCFFFLVQYFVQLSWLQYIVVIIALAAFSASLLNASRLPRLLGMLMMGTGIALELLQGNGLAGIGEGIFLVLPLLCLITLAPLLSIPLKFSGFFGSVSRLLHQFLDQPKKLYAGITGTLFFLGPILNLASVRIIHEFLEDLKLPPALTAKSYVVGFATAAMWSPYFASVSLMIQYLHISYENFILYGVGLSILSLLIGNLLFALWEKRNPFPSLAAAAAPIEKSDRYQLMKLGLFVVILLALCLLVEKLTNWSMIVIVSLFAVIVPFLFILKRGNWTKMAPLFEDYRKRNVPLMSNEIVLFMSAGLLAYALKGTSLMNGVSDFLAHLAGQSFFLFAFALIFIVLCITYIGIHQIAVIGALAMQLSIVDLGISNLAIALILLLSWALSMSLSPFSGLNLLVSRFSKLSGVNVGLRANGLHLCIIAFISITLISFLA